MGRTIVPPSLKNLILLFQPKYCIAPLHCTVLRPKQENSNS